jgi:hypothetical protein
MGRITVGRETAPSICATRITVAGGPVILIPHRKLAVVKNGPLGIPWTRAERIGRELLRGMAETMRAAAA